MNNKYMFSLVSMLICGLVMISTPVGVSADEVMGVPDDTSGVYLFAGGGDESSLGACDGTPAGTSVADTLLDAIDFDILEHIGDEPEEVLEYLTGSTAPGDDLDTTLAEVVSGLTAIDDYGNIQNIGDNGANFDGGTYGELSVGLRNPFRIITADGVIADGILGGPTAAGSEAEADANLGGMEIFIFEDGELSGFEIYLRGPLNTYIIEIADFQINPGTVNGADDTVIGIDLDSLPGWDGTYITELVISDNGIEQEVSPNCINLDGSWDGSMEIDAIVTRGSAIAELGAISGNVSNDIDGDAMGDMPIPDVQIYLTDETGLPVLDGFGDILEVMSDSEGNYVFTDIPPGFYNVVQVQPDGYEDVAEVDGGDDGDHPDDGINNQIPVTVDSGEVDTGNDFIETSAQVSAVTLNTQTSNGSLSSSLWVLVGLSLALLSLSLIRRERAGDQ